MDKLESISAIVREMYQTAAELTISADKDTQTRGKKLRQLIESVELHIKGITKKAE